MYVHSHTHMYCICMHTCIHIHRHAWHTYVCLYINGHVLNVYVFIHVIDNCMFDHRIIYLCLILSFSNV